MQEIVKVSSGRDLIQSYANKKQARQIFGNFIFEGELCVLFGDSNAGKSILANEIAFFVSGGGHKWPNMVSPHISSLYIDMELTSGQFARRYANAVKYIPEGYSRAEVTANTTEDKWGYVKNKIIMMQGHGNAPKFIVIDNITNGFGSIYSAKKMASFVMDMKTLKERYRLTILLIAHCPKRNKKKPIDQDALGGSKMILNFVDSAFAINTSFQDDDIRYIKQVKVRECQKDKDVLTVQIKGEPYLSMWDLGKCSEETHIDPKHTKVFYNFTPEEEIQLVNLLTRKNNGEKIYYSEIAQKTGVPYDIVVLYDIENFHLAKDKK